MFGLNTITGMINGLMADLQQRKQAERSAKNLAAQNEALELHVKILEQKYEKLTDLFLQLLEADNDIARARVEVAVGQLLGWQKMGIR